LLWCDEESDRREGNSSSSKENLEKAMAIVQKFGVASRAKLNLSKSITF
jgi:hypothetical protein